MLFNLLLIVHVFSGALVLLMSVFVLLTKKGSLRHRQMGRLFYYGMAGVCLTACPMSIIHINVLLFFIALFSFHRTYVGVRFAGVHHHADFKRDKKIAYIMSALSAIFFLIGIMGFQVDGSQKIVLLIFAPLSLLNCLQELKYYSQLEGHGQSRRTMHLRAMLGGVTAAYTAFLVVVIPAPSEYEFVVFLTPALVLTWIRVYWERRIKKQ